MDEIVERYSNARLIDKIGSRIASRLRLYLLFFTLMVQQLCWINCDVEEEIQATHKVDFV